MATARILKVLSTIAYAPVTLQVHAMTSIAVLKGD